MATNRFQVTLVSEKPLEIKSMHPSEMIPLINVEPAAAPSPPPSIPATFTSVNEITKSSNRLLSTLLQRWKSNSSSIEAIPTADLSPISMPHSVSNINLPVNSETEKPDLYYSTTHSNIFDTNSLRFTNKFLHELRTKRRELHEKAKNLPIDQRIALNRQTNDREIIRAQDIFAVHFETDDNDNASSYTFTQDAQEKIRNNIFNELDRQRMKKYHKQHRQLILGRALLIFITSLLVFMAITLIYVVIDLFDRAKSVDSSLPEADFVSITYDKTVDFQL